MSEELKSPFQVQRPQAQQQSTGDVVKGDLSTILVGLGTMLDGTLTPLSKIVASTLDSLTVVAKQILDGINNSINENKGR
ncbi:MAG: hypothetical protein HGB00_04305 [Chlorobiaceae bacterium]|nr:hypothetical protein [Chlorobiaceae bacterium]